MTRRDDLKDVTIALVATSAVLLTILAVSHFYFPASFTPGGRPIPSSYTYEAETLVGLSGAILCGMGTLGTLLVFPSVDPLRKVPLISFLFLVTCILFLLGLGGIGTLLASNIHP
jgi:uncharacterized membrane protein